MADTRISSDEPIANPSGSTDQLKEREKKFDEEGGDQAQAPSQTAVDEELERARLEELLDPSSQRPNTDVTPGRNVKRTSGGSDLHALDPDSVRR